MKVKICSSFSAIGGDKDLNIIGEKVQNHHLFSFWPFLSWSSRESRTWGMQSRESLLNMRSIGLRDLDYGETLPRRLFERACPQPDSPRGLTNMKDHFFAFQRGGHSHSNPACVLGRRRADISYGISIRVPHVYTVTHFLLLLFL